MERNRYSDISVEIALSIATDQLSAYSGPGNERCTPLTTKFSKSMGQLDQLSLATHSRHRIPSSWSSTRRDKATEPCQQKHVTKRDSHGVIMPFRLATGCLPIPVPTSNSPSTPVDWVDSRELNRSSLHLMHGGCH